MFTGQDHRSRQVGVNIPPYERALTVALGSAALAFGVRALIEERRSPLGWILAAVGAPLIARGVSGRSVVYRQLTDRKGVEARRSVTVLRPRSEVYRLWRRLENLPRFMNHVTDVTSEDNRVSHWVVDEGPMTLEWLAEIVEDVPDRRIAWRSIPGGDVDNEGTVEFRDAPGDRGTEVHVWIRYNPPGGLIVKSALGGLLRRFTSLQLDAELTRLRQLLETGELATGASNRDDRNEVERKVAPIQGTPVHALGNAQVTPPRPAREGV
jgi:uncharacterized membrane protein